MSDRRKVFIKDRDKYKGLNIEEKEWLKEFNDLESNCYMKKYLVKNKIYKELSEEDRVKIEKELKEERESRRKDLLSKME